MLRWTTALRHRRASSQPLRTKCLVTRFPGRKIIGEVEGWEDARLLTDDQAPVEQAWDLMALEYAR